MLGLDLSGRLVLGNPEGKSGVGGLMPSNAGFTMFYPGWEKEWPYKRPGRRRSKGWRKHVRRTKSGA